VAERVAVTGGTGFIGEHLVFRLLSEGHSVRALVRPGKREKDEPPFPFPEQPELTWGDVTDPEATSNTLEQSQTVFHLAGCARAWAPDPDEYYAVNERGTGNVLSAAREHGVQTVVHVSTALLEGIEDPSDPRDALTEYQRSKLAGEKVVRGYVEEGGDAVVVRPSRVFGPGRMSQANSVTQVIGLYRRGLFRFRIADGDARANYVHVDDVVDGMMRAAGFRDGGGATGAAYALGGDDATMAEFLAAIGAATGSNPAVIALPKPIASSVAAVSELFARFGIDPLITRDWVELFTRDWPVSSKTAIDELGFRPRSLADGVRQTVRWLEAGRPSPFTGAEAEWQSA
jgi:nucleoside-diphosphate-sugar epimerase